MAKNVEVPLLMAIGLFLGAYTCIFRKLHEKQPDPYMDEIFHVPQAQTYCAGNFTQVFYSELYPELHNKIYRDLCFRDWPYHGLTLSLFLSSISTSKLKK